MKKISILLLGLVALLCTGCPVGLDYAIGEPGSEKIDQGLVGKWLSENSGAEVLSVDIAKKDDHSYKVTVLERGEMYALETDNLTGWVTTVNGGNFLYLKPDGEDKFYHYQYRFDGKDLVTNDVSLLDGGIDAVTSTETLRKQVATSMGMDGWADEKNTWTKE